MSGQESESRDEVWKTLVLSSNDIQGHGREEETFKRHFLIV
jgi:hypothetical protein